MRTTGLPSKHNKIEDQLNKESLLAKESAKILEQAIKSHSLKLEITDEVVHQTVVIPKKAAKLLLKMLKQMASGKQVTLLPTESELSTQEAAKLLNVSRPYFINLLEKGKLPFRKVGLHRRVRLHDLLTYKKQDDKMRQNALNELVKQAQELDMGY